VRSSAFLKMLMGVSLSFQLKAYTYSIKELGGKGKGGVSLLSGRGK